MTLPSSTGRDVKRNLLFLREDNFATSRVNYSPGHLSRSPPNNDCLPPIRKRRTSLRAIPHASTATYPVYHSLDQQSHLRRQVPWLHSGFPFSAFHPWVASTILRVPSPVTRLFVCLFSVGGRRPTSLSFLRWRATARMSSRSFYRQRHRFSTESNFHHSLII